MNREEKRKNMRGEGKQERTTVQRNREETETEIERNAQK